MEPVVRDLVQTDRFRERLAAFSADLGQPSTEVEHHATRAFGEMLAHHDRLALAAWRRLGGAVSRRCRVEVDDRALVQLREIDKEHSICWLPSHRSYIDTFLLEEVAQSVGIKPAYVLGGDNIDFFPLGTLLRRAGTIFIRRNTKDDPIYRFALRSYLAYLIDQGENLTWSIEGGRTRTGKLRPPRYGALRYVVDAVRSGDGPDVMIVPVSVVYDQLAEVAMMATEALGGSKKPEGIGWLLRFVKTQQALRSKATINFGEPLPMRAQLQEIERDPRAEGQEVERLALEICHRINRVTPAVPTAIVTFALLGASRALTLDETVAAMAPMLAYLRDHPTTPNTLGSQLEDAGWVRGALDKLTDSGVLERFSGGEETIWRIASDQHLIAAFYRNTLIHLLVNRAIAELALFMALEDSRGDLRESLWNHALSLRQLLKFDFFFSSRAEFSKEMWAEIRVLDPEWDGHAVREPVLTRQRLERWLELSQPHLAHLILRPFFDSYLVVAEQLAHWPHDREVDEQQFLKRCLGYGRQQVMQRRLHSPESVTLELFRPALKLAANRGLVAGTGREVHEQRRAFATDVRRIVRDLEALSRIQSQSQARSRKEPPLRRPRIAP